ncbi:uncharacterized protein LOC133917314 [Phragmites australis]|uniref:uncharacterized protein LOC133917314 n=1 Tax=Phragmites australis TaxID=29695 RepID=UPI002D78DECA|nr:uncharacterized protein LOC133917314 [Phragmites australis]
MGIPRSELKERAKPFHGITPNSSTMTFGQIELPVTFGAPDNFHIKKLNFDVVDFETAYNVILGHQMLGKFTVVVHYVYQVLKNLGPKGEITVKGDQRTMVKYNKQSLEMVEHFCRIATTSRDIESKGQKYQDATKRKDSAKDSKLMSVTDTSKSNDPAKGETNDVAQGKKTIKIGADLHPK